ncbi:MAG: multidrug ABC transporter substrate-binding protein [Chthoniobacterales bacterium]|nr:MAG: multidrug ABC transporter substrate-binding protein [Chthoniobacterales bacterium]
MDFLSTIQIALRALLRNKSRSILTMLGIIIGVGAVIAMIGIGQGADQTVQKQIATLGSNMLFITPGSGTQGGLRVGNGSTKTLVEGDVAAILKECPAVVAAAPATQTSAQIVYEGDNWGTRIIGTTPEYFDIRTWAFQSGTSFTRDDVTTAANVAVIGETVRKNLFASTDPIGKKIRIGNLPFLVVGVLVAKGQSAALSEDQDDTIIAPLTTVQKKMTGQPWLRFAMASASSRSSSYAAQQQIKALLRDRHRIRAGATDDFSVRNLADIADVASEASKVMTLLLGSIGAVSLFVGGLGIMNIMLVSVTERTREIGIRIAIGATESDVQRQFLLEAITISLLGGLIGILTGVASSFVISSTAGWPIAVSTTAIFVAALVSIAIGVFFGFYPARKAARLDPIEALRYE